MSLAAYYSFYPIVATQQQRQADAPSLPFFEGGIYKQSERIVNRQSHFKINGVKLIILFFILAILPQPAYGQNSSIIASTNKTHYTTDELVILTVTVVDNSPQQPRPILPPLDGLAVIEFDIATNVSSVNGQLQTEVVYTYQLQPRRTGEITIPPVTAKIGGEIFSAPPITIIVNQGTAPAPSPGNAVPPYSIAPPAEVEGKDFFVEAVINTSNPYVGQQVVYTFRFYQAIKLYQPPQYEMPIFSSFDTVGLPVQEYNLDIGDRTFLISEVSMALFPKTSGAITIGPARLTIPGNYFEEPIELYTAPATLQVKNLPGNAPAGFNGAVGQFEIEANFSPQVAVANQPATLAVTIKGSGNIHTLPEPIWPNLSNWQMYDSLGNVTTEMNNRQLTGVRLYERVITSDKVGDFVIPPTKFVYFDPVAGEYRTIATKSLSGRIIPAPTPDSATATEIARLAQATPTPISPVNIFGTPAPPRAVIEISPDSLDWVGGIILPVGVILLWAMCSAIPIAAALGAGGFWLWQKRQQQTAIQAEALQLPAQKMHPILAHALAKSHDNYKAVNQAIRTYLSEMLTTSVHGSTQTEIIKLLQERGLDKAVINKVKECLIESEMGRYGPGTDDQGWALLSKTDELLFELDEVFKARGS